MRGLRAVLLVLSLALPIDVPACYKFNPAQPCEITCETSCPNGLTCDQGRCHGPGQACTGDGGTIDGPGDGSGSDAKVCAGSAGYVHVCFGEAGSGDLTLPTMLDTDTYPPCLTRDQQTGPKLCVVVAGTIEVPRTTHVIGSRPLVLVATDTITIGSDGDGLAVALDAGSHRSSPFPQIGAAANDSACTVATDPSLGSAGAAGGSFQGKGGAGGAINGTGGAPGGVAGAAQQTTVLRGGCPGAAVVGDGSGISAGAGGGALWLIAAEIDVFGSIDASGAGGAPGEPVATSAGGGGGAGGMIGLEAPVVRIADGARVSANGGGGGGGGQGVGGDGTDPTACKRSGGQPGAGDGGGGISSCGTVLAGGKANSGNNVGDYAGGGGGGAGWLVVYTHDASMLGSAGSGSDATGLPVQPVPTVTTF